MVKEQMPAKLPPLLLEIGNIWAELEREERERGSR